MEIVLTVVTLLYSSPSFWCASKREPAKLRLPLRLLSLPGPHGLRVSFPVCLGASGLPQLSGVALLSVHEGPPFSPTNGPVANFSKR